MSKKYGLGASSKCYKRQPLPVNENDGVLCPWAKGFNLDVTWNNQVKH